MRLRLNFYMAKIAKKSLLENKNRLKERILTKSLFFIGIGGEAGGWRLLAR